MEGIVCRTGLEVHQDHLTKTNNRSLQQLFKPFSSHMSNKSIDVVSTLWSTYQSWKVWLVLRIVGVHVVMHNVVQDWQGFQLHKVVLRDLTASTKKDITGSVQAEKTDGLEQQQVLEYRYMFRGNKFRLCFRANNVVKFPPYEVSEVPRMPKCEVLIATQAGKNITEKIKKYAGPKGDFHYTITKALPTAHYITQRLGPVRIIDTKFRSAALF